MKGHSIGVQLPSDPRTGHKLSHMVHLEPFVELDAPPARKVRAPGTNMAIVHISSSYPAGTRVEILR